MLHTFSADQWRCDAAAEIPKGSGPRKVKPKLARAQALEASFRVLV